MYAIRSYYGLAQANAEADKKKAQPAAAPMEEQFMIAPQIGYAVYSNDEFDFETNIVAGLRFEAAVHPHFTFGASFSYTNMTITHRITSYNVCYTKLLRHKLLGSPNDLREDQMQDKDQKQIV